MPPTSTSRRTLGTAAVIAGLIITLLAIFADVLNYGTGDGFGYYQMIVLIGGIVAMLIGMSMIVMSPDRRARDSDYEPEP